MESNKDLQNQNKALNANMQRLKNLLITKNKIIRQYNFHLKQLKKRVDYIIEHPWSVGNGMSGRKIKVIK